LILSIVCPASASRLSAGSQRHGELAMGSSDLFKALTGGRKPKTSPQEIRLTPYVAIVSAILYMMAVDGEISERESSQLQSVIGSDEDILHSAIAYVETHGIDQFLVAAPSAIR
jgi:uncharacterized tellurite resistance protein B-like protein